KHTWLGPLAMGGCRFLNVLMGLSLTNFVNIPVELALHIAGVVGLYIVGVTWFARTEEGQSRPRWLVAATLVMLVSLGLLLGLPLHFPPGSTTILVPYLIVAFGAYLARAILPAIRSPEPKPVQHAVKTAIGGLILLDAILATVAIGPAGLLLVLLLFPTRRLGQYLYST
ncbi:MAG: UbiA family prenyltransferase, partial [Gemmataceae bacterium]